MSRPLSHPLDASVRVDQAPHAPLVVRPEDAAVFSNALETVREELLAMSPFSPLPMNVDLRGAVFAVVSSAEEIRRFRPAMAEWFGEEMAASVDRLEVLAHAAGKAHALYQAEQAGLDVAPLVDELHETRQLLLHEVRSLILRKLVPRGRLHELSRGNGHKQVCFDVVHLVGVLRDDWAKLDNETGLTLPYLDRAEALASTVMRAVGVRDHGAKTATAELRERAFALLDQTYDTVRRMLWFLRWKEADADRIAPSLRRGGRGKRRTREDAEPAPDATTAGGAR